MSKMIFVNLPVTDLKRSIVFYESIGGEKEPKFSNEQAAMIRWSDTIHFMLLTHDFYATFTAKPIGDAHAQSDKLIALSAESRRAVDDLIDQAAAAGGKSDPGPIQEMGDMMYGRSFEDPDGHHFEIMWMSDETAEEGQSAFENT